MLMERRNALEEAEGAVNEPEIQSEVVTLQEMLAVREHASAGALAQLSVAVGGSTSVDAVAPLSVAAGGSTSLLGACFAQLDAAQLDALSTLSVAAGGSATVVSSGGSATVVCSGVGSDTAVPVRVACVNCAGTGSLPQQFGLPVDPACLRCWGSGEVWSHEYGAGWPSL